MLTDKEKTAIRNIAKGQAKVAAREAARAPRAAREIPAQPEWTQERNVDGLRIDGSRFFAVPTTGRKTARNFDVLDLDAGEFVCQLTKNEVRAWLLRAAA